MTKLRIFSVLHMIQNIGIHLFWVWSEKSSSELKNYGIRTDRLLFSYNLVLLDVGSKGQMGIKKKKKNQLYFILSFKHRTVTKSSYLWLFFLSSSLPKSWKNRNNSENVKVFPNMRASFSLLHKYNNYCRSYWRHPPLPLCQQHQLWNWPPCH